MPPTKGMEPQRNPHARPSTCLIQCNTSPNWSCLEVTHRQGETRGVSIWLDQLSNYCIEQQNMTK